MPNNIGPKIGIDGERDFRQEISQINNSLKTMGAEMDMVTSAFIGNEKSVEALTAKNELLSARFDELSKKADAQKARLSELDAAGVDPTSASYQKLLQDLYKTEAQMNKTEAEIKGNAAEMNNLGKETEETAESLDKGGEASKRMSDNLKANLLSQAIIGGVKALGDGLKKLGRAILDAAGAADDLNTLSVKTGIATDELQKLQYAAGTIDVDVNTVAGAMGKLTKNMDAAAGGSGAAADAFSKLGVAVKKDDGTFRDRNEVFQDAIKALGGIADETERDATAMAIFGKSATELNPLIKGGAEELAALGAHAEEAGLILSGDTLNSLAGLADRFDVLKQTVGLAGQQFLAQFAGPLTEGINTLIGYVERLVSAFQKGGLAELGNEVGKVATDMASAFTSALPQIASFASNVIITLVNGLISMLPAVVESAITIVNSLASSISSALPELIPVAVDAILALVDTLTNPNSIESLINAALELMLSLSNGLIQAVPELVRQAPFIIKNIVTALIAETPQILSAALQLIVSLGLGLIEAIPELVLEVPKIISAIVGGLIDGVKDIIAVGGQLVSGLWEGIKNSWNSLVENVKGLFGGFVASIKDLLGIASPSKVFAGIGDNMAAGIGVGFERTMAGVERDMMSSIPVPTVNASVGATGADGDFSGFGSEKVVIGFDVDADGLVRFLRPYIKDEDLRVGGAMVI